MLRASFVSEKIRGNIFKKKYSIVTNGRPGLLTARNVLRGKIGGEGDTPEGVARKKEESRLQSKVRVRSTSNLLWTAVATAGRTGGCRQGAGLAGLY